jgi:hypothetical protein
MEPPLRGSLVHGARTTRSVESFALHQAARFRRPVGSDYEQGNFGETRLGNRRQMVRRGRPRGEDDEGGKLGLAR